MLSQLQSLLRGASLRYDQVLTKFPIPTKLATGMGLSLAGDRSAQCITNTEETIVWDNERTVRQASWSIVGLPIMHFWYQYLQTVKSVPRRVLLDQLIFSPPIMAAYFAYLGLAQNKNPSEVVEEVQQKLGSVMCVNWVVWFPVQAINLSIVPLPYRVLVANCVGFCYGIFLSYAANNDEFGE
jgi:hypothetical protein